MSCADQRLSHRAAVIWHKLIPGAAISFDLLAETLLSNAFNSHSCLNQTEAIFRSMAFAISWLVGLKTMKWTFPSDDLLSPNKKYWMRIKHAVVNVGVVTFWLFTISDFPLLCWIGNENQEMISGTRAISLLSIQALVLLEIVETNQQEDTDVVANPQHAEEGNQAGALQNEQSKLLG
ncbi:expressed unknown protein [Seminavis robusta]|uniref:Uncharacterized protein n=1 Tax=Seminavis robusta TaxID=568900 RepID=A0A9N8DB70_9STRA|nr:expressed unknown protein [Seminavis robusta]|eukprot:Sro21_g014950.1 n/a (178) ;mRNA; f:149523-150056